MHLTDEERAIADGARGDVLADLIREQVAVGDFFGADRFVPVVNAHVMGDLEVLGEAGLTYLNRLADAGCRVAVPTTRNAQSVDFAYAEALAQAPRLVEGEHEVRALLGRLGVSAVNTCIGYQNVYQPSPGEHVAWGDTGTVAYANSVLGARTNYESGAAGVAAAVLGRTPAYGFHLDEHRRANVRVRVTAPLTDLADWGALGAVVGERARGYWNVAAIETPDGPPATSDQLKQLGASLASYGSMAMFHLVGQTPEAPTLDAATGSRDVVDEIEVGPADIEAVYARDLAEGSDVDLVVFSGPQLSFVELRHLAERLRGRTVAPTTRVIATTSVTTAAGLQEVGLLADLEDAGVMVLRGTCWYVMDPAAQRRAFGWTNVVTNSAKLSNIVRAHGYRPALRRTDECIDAALTGYLPARPTHQGIS